MRKNDLRIERRWAAGFSEHGTAPSDWTPIVAPQRADHAAQMLAELRAGAYTHAGTAVAEYRTVPA